MNELDHDIDPAGTLMVPRCYWCGTPLGYFNFGPRPRLCINCWPTERQPGADMDAGEPDSWSVSRERSHEWEVPLGGYHDEL